MTALQARDQVLQAAALEAARAFAKSVSISTTRVLRPPLNPPPPTRHSPAFCACVLPHIARLFQQMGGSEPLKLQLLHLLGDLRAEQHIMAAALQLALNLQPACLTRSVGGICETVPLRITSSVIVYAASAARCCATAWASC